MKNLLRCSHWLLLSIVSVSFLAAQTGKITGVVKDSKTGEPLISTNVVIEGTTLGAATNLEGFFAILNVPPGTYAVRASMIGYAPSIVTDVRVSINQTTDLAFSMQEMTLETEEVVVVADRPIVERDVAASRINITANEVRNLPIMQVSSVIGLQAGIQGLTIRGGAADQTAFIIDGLTLRDERTNDPYTSVSLLSVQDFQIQTGGFNAEYGNIRSGVINVVTKEGDVAKYSVGAAVRYSPPAKKYFDIAPNNFNSYWIRPFLDDDVAWTGTQNGAWDPYVQRQYIRFEGWNSISQKTLADDDPANDLSPSAAQRLFLWQHRKVFDITKPDYDVDLGFGGPVPGGEEFGKLRFYASARHTSTQFAVPLSREAASDYNVTLKVTSDIDQGMKLMVEGLYGRNESVDRGQTGVYSSFGSPASIALEMNRVSYIDARLFSTDYWAPNAVDRSMYGAKFTHVLSSSTFYELSFQRFSSSYDTNPGRLRDISRVFKFGDSYFDEAPFGFVYVPGTYTLNGIDGSMRMAVGMSNARDSSKVVSYTLRGDISSQFDRYNELKGGFEVVLTDNRVNYGSVDSVLQSGRSSSSWETFPKRFSVYLQDKLEFEGMVANVGLRFEASHAGGEWYVYDPFTRVFRGQSSLGIDTALSKEPTDIITALSPRLGVAFPITEDAKLFFNYGHFRSMPDPDDLFLVRRESVSKDILRLANPNLPFEKTVAYELGYEHNLLDMFLLRATGYYKDVTNQSRLVTFRGYNNIPNYTVTTNNLYEDIRGFEISLNKTRGNWIQGFVNYTYMVSTNGYFGYSAYNQNPVDQREVERENIPQDKPVPRPYARANIDLFSPSDFGPEFAGIHPFGDLRVNLLASWSSGFHFTWVGGGSIPGVRNNIQWKDNFFFDVRVSKAFTLGPLDIDLFMDINNVLYLRQMATTGSTPLGFVDTEDYLNYMKSLHLSGDFNKYRYGNIEGEDEPGDYRHPRVKFQPLEFVEDIQKYVDGTLPMSSLNSVAFYYDAASKRYYQLVGSQLQLVDQGRINQVLEDKAYIDMPNQPWWTFLNPRDIYFGMRVSFAF